MEKLNLQKLKNTNNTKKSNGKSKKMKKRMSTKNYKGGKTRTLWGSRNSYL
jgi:hypothetical protein